MKLYCPNGHEVKVRFNPVPGERFCPEHGCSLRPPPKGMGGSAQREGLPGEKAAKANFRRVVTRHPCFFLDSDEFGERRRPDHSCTYPLDSHHLIPKGWIKRELTLPPEELVAVMWNPLIGAPLCRAAHEAVERGVADIYYPPNERRRLRLPQRGVHHEQITSPTGRYLSRPDRQVALWAD